MHRSKVTEACYIDCSTSATEEEKNVDEIGRYATWIYARKMDDGCLFMSRRMDEEYRKKREHHVLCAYRESVRSCFKGVHGVDKVEKMFTRE